MSSSSSAPDGSERKTGLHGNRALALLLIQARWSWDEQFNDVNVKKRSLWQKISAELAEQMKDEPMLSGADQRENRWKNLLVLLLLLYTLFIVEMRTGKMPNNIGPTVNKMLKDIVEK